MLNALCTYVFWAEKPLLLLLTFVLSWLISQDDGLGRFERHHYASRLRSGAGNASQFAISLLKHIWAEANGNLGHFG